MDYLRLKDTVNDLENQVLRSEMRRQELELKFEQLMRERAECEQSVIRATTSQQQQQKDGGGGGGGAYQHYSPSTAASATASLYKQHPHFGRPPSSSSNQVEWSASSSPSSSSRNRNLMRMLDRIDFEAASLAARTEKLKLVKHTQELDLMKKWHARHLLRDSSLITHQPADVLVTQFGASAEAVAAAAAAQSLHERDEFRITHPPYATTSTLFSSSSRPTLEQQQQRQHQLQQLTELPSHRSVVVPTSMQSTHSVSQGDGGDSSPSSHPTFDEISINDTTKSDFPKKYLSEINQFQGRSSNSTYDRNDIISDNNKLVDFHDYRRRRSHIDEQHCQLHQPGNIHYSSNNNNDNYNRSSSSNNNNNNISLGYSAIKSSSSRDRNHILANDDTTTNANDNEQHHPHHFGQVAQQKQHHHHHQKSGIFNVDSNVPPIPTIPAAPSHQPYICYAGKRWVLDVDDTQSQLLPLHHTPPNVETNYVAHNAPHCSRTHVDVDNNNILLVTPILSNVNTSNYLKPPPSRASTTSRNPAPPQQPPTSTDNDASLYAAWLEARWAKRAAEEAEAEVLRISQKRRPFNAHHDYYPNDNIYLTSTARRTQLLSKLKHNYDNNTQQYEFMSRPIYPEEHHHHHHQNNRRPNDAVNLNTISDDNPTTDKPTTHVTETLKNNTRHPSLVQDQDDLVSTTPSHVPNQVVSILNTSPTGDTTTTNVTTNATAINSNESDAIKAIRHGVDGQPDDRIIYEQNDALPPEMTNTSSSSSATATGTGSTVSSAQKTQAQPNQLRPEFGNVIAAVTSNTSNQTPANNSTISMLDNETYANHVPTTAIRPSPSSSIYEAAAGAATADKRHGESSDARQDSSSSAPKQPPQLADIEESLYGEKITAMDVEDTTTNTSVIDAAAAAGSTRRRPVDEALNNVHGEEQQHVSNGINNNNHHLHNSPSTTTNGYEVAASVLEQTVDGSSGAVVDGDVATIGQTDGDYDTRQSIRSDLEAVGTAGAAAAAHEIDETQHQYATDQYPVDEYQQQYDPNLTYDESGNPIPNPNITYDADGLPITDTNQYYAEPTADYNYDQSVDSNYEQPTNEYPPYQQEYDAQPGTEYNADTNYQDQYQQPTTVDGQQYEQTSEQYPLTSDDQQQFAEQTAYPEQSYVETTNGNQEQYMDRAQQQQQFTEQYDQYYGQQQPGEQYYADDQQQQQVYDPSQTIENSYQADLTATTDYYANSENTISSSIDDPSQLGQVYTQQQQPTIEGITGPTDYVVSEADDSSGALQSEIQPDGSSNIMAAGDRSESDFDFSTN